MQITATKVIAPTQERSRPTAPAARFWEVDALRSVAIVMMVVYHVMYDLYYFRVTDTIFTNPFWFYFQRTTATLFVGLVGVSLGLRSARAQHRLTYVVLLKRGLYVLAWGLVISVVTRIALGPDLYIRFGVLHFIGFAILLAYPFLRRYWLNLILGVGLIALGVWLQQFEFGRPWSYLFWLGLEPANHTYVDFFPFIRWFGVVLIGIFLSNLLYGQAAPTGHPKFPLPDRTDVWYIRALTRMSRRSLPIYLLHQPILFALFLALLLLLRRGALF